MRLYWENMAGRCVCVSLCVCVFSSVVCVFVCAHVSFHLAQTAYIHHAMAVWQRVGLRQLH